MDQYIETFETENALIAEENRQKTEDYLYFTSEEYIDKIAKQNLGLVNQGEEVIVLSVTALNDEVESDEEEYSGYAKYSEMSNFEKWWSFFFDN